MAGLTLLVTYYHFTKSFIDPSDANQSQFSDIFINR